MNWKRLEQPRNSMGKSDMAGDNAHVRLAAATENVRGQPDQVRGGRCDILFELGERPHRIVVTVEPAALDKPIEPIWRKPVTRASREQCRGHRMALDLSPAATGEHVTPPLESDFAG